MLDMDAEEDTSTYTPKSDLKEQDEVKNEEAKEEPKIAKKENHSRCLMTRTQYDQGVNWREQQVPFERFELDNAERWLMSTKKRWRWKLEIFYYL